MNQGRSVRRFDWQSLLENALRAGIGVEEFWRLTPRETYAAIRAENWRQDLHHRRQAWLAWHIAALSRSKRLPSFKKLIGADKARALEGEELERRRRERDEMVDQIDIDKLNEQMRDKHGR